MLHPGSNLGPFTIESPLGRGGMGVVYRARDARGGAVALKVLNPLFATDQRLLERFRREAHAAKLVRHPNVVSCLESGEAASGPWIAFELVPGGSLKDRLVAKGKLSWRRAARLGAEVARGLAAIHQAGLVHRDVKPANILLDAE
ncbi:MAG: serine/threonine-protein kinase, partial [Planctomycetota bacterium]